MEWQLSPCARLCGEIRVPGDKSIGHRSLMLSAVAEGDAEIDHLPSGEDVASTAAVLRALGVEIDWTPGAEGVRARVSGRGRRGLRASPTPLDCGNSGTTMRLMAGLLAGHPFESILTGDRSLRRRPMGRVAEPLRTMGAEVRFAREERAPMTIRGGDLRGVTHRPPVASAQVKSCVLLAGLNARGPTVVVEPRATRDHTERMLVAAGATVVRDGEQIFLEPEARLRALDGRVPGDLSSAAYLMVAGSVGEGSRLRIEGVGLNPTRSAVIDVLRSWGADLAVEPHAEVWGEPVGDVCVRGVEELEGGPVPAELVPILIDELPLLGMLAPLTRTGLELRGAAELRVKESDRIATTCAAIRALGGEVEEYPDGFAVRGGTGLAGGRVQAGGDHRIALAAAAVSVAVANEVRIEGAEAAAVSWPGFNAALAELATP